MARVYSIEIDENTFFLGLGWYIHGIYQIYTPVYVYTWYIHGIYQVKLEYLSGFQMSQPGSGSRATTSTNLKSQ